MTSGAHSFVAPRSGFTPADPDSPDALGPHRYWPALDGVRAVAVSAVVAYHLGYLPGGWIGVDVFFVLSGFLITTLLMTEAGHDGRIRLGSFWARRARRLLPAVLTLLAVIGTYGWVGGPGVVAAQLRAPALATLLYGANWQQIGAGHSYFAHFSAPDPLTHTWSLAIEEQYYLFWPLMVSAVLYLGRRRSWPIRGCLLGTAAILGTASAVWMGVAAHMSGYDRAYLGTDTRAWELLAGAGAALWMSREPKPAGSLRASVRRRRRRVRMWLPVLGAAGVGLAFAQAGGPPGWVWDGGLVAAALGALAVVVGVTRDPDSPLARLLSWVPLRWLGRVSYSLYLWHWPVIVLLGENDSGLSGASLLTVRLLAMSGATCASYYLIERPLRRADWGGWWRRSLPPLALAGTAGLILVGTVTPAAAGTAALRPTAPAALPGPPVSLPAGRVPTPGDPLRVWILGDSVMNDASPGVTAALEATGLAKVVANSSYGGWGLTRDKLWPGDGEDIIRQYRPELVIGTWSWDDQAAEKDPLAYEARLRTSVAGILAPGDGVDAVVLLQFPPSGPYPRFPSPAGQRAAWLSTLAGEDDWDAAARAAVQAFPGRAAYLTTADLFAPGGSFLVWMQTPAGAWVRARKVDDIHVCPYGAAELGALVVGQLGTPLHLGSLHPGWQTGRWTLDPRYDDPPGACPADQPPAHYRGTPMPPAVGPAGPGASSDGR